MPALMKAFAFAFARISPLFEQILQKRRRDHVGLSPRSVAGRSDDRFLHALFRGRGRHRGGRPRGGPPLAEGKGLGVDALDLADLLVDEKVFGEDLEHQGSLLGRPPTLDEGPQPDVAEGFPFERLFPVGIVHRGPSSRFSMAPDSREGNEPGAGGREGWRGCENAANG